MDNIIQNIKFLRLSKIERFLIQGFNELEKINDHEEILFLLNGKLIFIYSVNNNFLEIDMSFYKTILLNLLDNNIETFNINFNTIKEIIKKLLCNKYNIDVEINRIGLGKLRKI